MANKHKGELAFEADGESYQLRYSVNELCDLESLFPGKNSDDLAKSMAAGSLTHLRAFMWAGLKGGGHKDIGLLEAGDLVASVGLMQSTTLIMEAVRLAFPKQEGGSAGQGPPPAGTGSDSSSAG